MKKNRKRSRPFCSVVVAAAGSSERMGLDKLEYIVGGMPVLARTLAAVNGFECVDEIIVVTKTDKIVETAAMCRDYGIDKAAKILCGGLTRTESVLAGLSEIDPKAELAAIHDGARPLVTEEIFENAVMAASADLAAAPAVSPGDTVKLAEAGSAVSTIDRRKVMLVQTPQVFEADLIKAALTAAFEQGLELTDDCAAVEALGVKVRLVEGSRENIKLTTALDIIIMEAILKYRGEHL